MRKFVNVVGKAVLTTKKIMTRLIDRLGLNSTARTSKNVWLSSLFIFLLFGVNYMRLMMPEEVFFLLTFGLSVFGFISLIAYIYLTIKDWSIMRDDKRIGEIFYIGLLTFVTILFSLLPLKILAIMLL